MRRALVIALLIGAAWGCGGASRSQRADARPSRDDGETTTTSATPVVLPVGDWRAAYVDRRPLRTMEGAASYYHDSLAGNSTASGEPYDPRQYTAANRDLPFGTVLRVVRVDTGRAVIVRVNDRGPFGRRRRILDLSRAAAEELGMIQRGVVQVRAEVLELGPGRRRSR